MIFLIDFPEFMFEGTPPFEKAYKMPTFRRDWRTIGTIAEAEGCYWYPLWYARGRNHREQDGMIVCDVKEPVEKWFIEVKTLEDFLGLVEKHGALKIRTSNEYIAEHPIIDLFD